LRGLQAAQTAAGLSSTYDDPHATSGAASPHIHQELMQLHRYTASASPALLVMSCCLLSSQASGVGRWSICWYVGDRTNLVLALPQPPSLLSVSRAVLVAV
jgi:hypothetical protein